MKCTTCGNEIKSNCDWQQGRCPHQSPMIDLDIFKINLYNMLNTIKGWFK